jgi:hypothetical protein
VPVTLEAKVVGAYLESGTNCSGTPSMTGQAMYLCPGGRIRGAGYIGNATELICGSFTMSAAVYSNCTDKVGCFPTLDATVKDTLIYGGVADVDPSFTFWMLFMETPEQVWRPTSCSGGTSGYIILQRQFFSTSADDCQSAACPAPGGSGGGCGSCGSDCDCGHCWYCEKSGGVGTCRYGGEGPYGCYRGCGQTHHVHRPQQAEGRRHREFRSGQAIQPAVLSAEKNDGDSGVNGFSCRTGRPVGSPPPGGGALPAVRMWKLAGPTIRP